MDIRAFAKSTNILSHTEIEKVRLLAYFHQKTTADANFSREDVRTWFSELNLASPNMHRLEKRISASKAFIRGQGKGKFRLHPIEFDALQAEYPGVHLESEEVISEDTILPRSLFENTRGFIESLAKQINASYDFNIFDGCAVLMRRLLEVLLILSYEHLGIDQTIRGADGNYVMLQKISDDAKSNRTLNLSRDSKALLDEFRTLGNFSAHKIYYNCRRGDLRRVTVAYRATFEELLYKAGIRS